MIIKLAKVFYRWTIPHLSLYTEKIYNLCKIAAETEHDYTVCVYGKNSRLHHHHTYWIYASEEVLHLMLSVLYNE